MADPLSIAASVVGVIVPALHGARLLLDDLQKINDAPETVKRLEDDVRSVDMALTSLQTVKDQEWKSLGTPIAEESKTTISICTRACHELRTDLQRWTRHSGDGRLKWQDRANIGFFKQGRIKTMSEQLQNCKVTINSVVSIATLYSCIRHSHITEEIKKAILTKQTDIASAIRTTDKQLAEVGERLGELNVTDDDQIEAESTKNRADALRQIEEERKALSTSRKLLNELLSKAQDDAVAKAAIENQIRSTIVTFSAQNSGFQIGVNSGPISGISFGGK